MILLFALAGPAEAAIALAVIIIATLLVISATFALGGALRFSRWSSITSIVCILITTILLKPWIIFDFPIQEDADETYWDNAWRFLSIAWLLISLFGLFSIYRAYSKKKNGA